MTQTYDFPQQYKFRKLTPPGWRLLARGEMTQPGDYVWAWDEWVQAYCSVICGNSYVLRRCKTTVNQGNHRVRLCHYSS